MKISGKAPGVIRGLFMAVLFHLFLSAGDGASAQQTGFVVSGTKVHTEIIESSPHEYTIRLGGTVDMDNTTTNGYSTYDVAFQPNVSLEIENIGASPVTDPWVVVNGERDWRTMESIVEDATRGARDDQERLMFIYEFARNRSRNIPRNTGRAARSRSSSVWEIESDGVSLKAGREHRQGGMNGGPKQ